MLESFKRDLNPLTSMLPAPLQAIPLMKTRWRFASVPKHSVWLERHRAFYGENRSLVTELQVASK